MDLKLIDSIKWVWKFYEIYQRLDDVERRLKDVINSIEQNFGHTLSESEVRAVLNLKKGEEENEGCIGCE